MYYLIEKKEEKNWTKLKNYFIVNDDVCFVTLVFVVLLKTIISIVNLWNEMRLSAYIYILIIVLLVFYF